MSNTGGTLVGAFDEHAWNFWGLTWVASLKELACYEGDFLIFDAGLSARAIATLRSAGARLVSIAGRYGLEPDALLALAEQPTGVYAYWHHSCYFQEAIDTIFPMASDRLLLCKDREPLGTASLDAFGLSKEASNDLRTLEGVFKSSAQAFGRPLQGEFFAGPAHLLAALAVQMRCCLDAGWLKAGQECVQTAVNLFALSQPDDVSVLPDVWSSLMGGQLVWDGCFRLGEEVVKVITTPVEMRYSAVSAYFNFVTRYPEAHAVWARREQPRVGRHIVYRSGEPKAPTSGTPEATCQASDRRERDGR